MNKNIFWDKNLNEKQVKEILEDDKDIRFTEYASLLLSRTNVPKEVFGAYIDKKIFYTNWNKIKRRMRKNKWNDNRIIFWDQIYRVMKEKTDMGKMKREKKERATLPEEIIHVCNEIRKQRKNRGWTQGFAAKKIGISQQTLSLVENGYLNFSFNTFIKIVKTLGLSIEVYPSNEKSKKDQINITYNNM